jgi:HEAT repeat protein/beta-lactamase regulating signal transducer with metallopeptidase domain
MTPAIVDAAATVVVSWLLTYAIHSTILLAVAAVASWRFADQHAWLDRIWKTAMIAPLVTASLNLEPIALPLGGRWAMPGVTTVTGSRVGTPTPAPERATPVAPAITAERVQPSPVIDRPAASDRTVPVTADRFTVWQSMMRSWPSIAGATWLIIAIVSVVRYGGRLRRVYQALGSGAPVTAGDLLDALDRLRRSRNHRRAIRLTTSAMCPVPLALAGRQIVLPERFLRQLDPEQQRAALAHEIAHVARRDPEWRIATEIVERVLFFQPLNRLARARLCDSAEFLCDEWAVQQTESPLALARCLSVIASWWAPADELPVGVSAMARSDSAMIRRVTRILNEPPRVATRPRLLWLAIPVMLVAVAAPRVQGTQPAAMAMTSAVTTILGAASVEKAAEQRPPQRQWAPSEIAAERAKLRIHRPARPADPLDERWRQALADAARQGFTDFWIVYAFYTRTHAGELMISDTRDGGLVVSSNGQIFTEGPPLAALFNASAVPLEGGNIAVLLHYRGARAAAIDRAGYRSAELGFDFGRAPVFWLGDAPESQSFERVESLFNQTRTETLQVLLIELASLHSNTDRVVPFLTRLVETSWPPAIRSEAAEGFEHHHDPRSVEVLLRVARTDPDSSVRAEAAETIGDVQTPQSIPALNDLVSESTDPAVRGEAAEAFASQPAAQAIPAIERVIATSEDEEVLGEVIEALGEIDDAAALPLLLQTAFTHRNLQAQREAVETLGDRDAAAAMTALERIAREHDREEVQAEAIETISDLSKHSVHPLILELAVSGRSPRVRREALDAIGEAVADLSDAQALDGAQRTIERAIFDDPDPSVRSDALDTLEEFPNDRAIQVLRDVIARHPDPRLRRDAEEQLRERR